MFLHIGSDSPLRGTRDRTSLLEDRSQYAIFVTTRRSKQGYRLTAGLRRGLNQTEGFRHTEKLLLYVAVASIDTPFLPNWWDHDNGWNLQVRISRTQAGGIPHGSATSNIGYDTRHAHVRAAWSTREQ